ncbi:hypothetical protein CPC16_009029 [Podila verticillata]|nr:hypothetical protein BGZ59_003809 [Podila verticillata]KAF9383210.1 hypothetical protein CPC16_009029 [Podila verticillata]KFH70943.1 hypothetical protein MVEG_03789 [Podila verticillata NRRL 6337]
MGIKQVKFSDWFLRRFPHVGQVVHGGQSIKFDSVFIDVNCILHPALRSSKTETAFVKKFFRILDSLLEQFVPGRICYLSIDGPAPLAKMLTQKARRLSKSGSKSKGMSSLQATPGCPFMTRVEHYLSYYTVRYLQQRRNQGISPDLKFVIDHSNNPGEGESKIIENIVLQAANIRERPCAIVSMDSDAILQAIALGMPNIHVVRKDGPAPGTVLSIDKFMHALEQIFPGESNRVRLDFCAICLFRGNDYLRGMAVGLEKLWKAYLYTKLADTLIQSRKFKFLIDTDFRTFDLFFLRQLMMNSEKHPSKLYLKSAQIGATEPVDEVWVDRAIAVEKEDEYGLESDKESVDDRSDNDTNSDAGSSESDSEPGILESEDKEDDELDVKSYSVHEYLVGILWNLEMYCSGKCPDVAYVYEFQYGPPRRAISEYVTALAQVKATQDLTPTSTGKIVRSAKTDRQYLHPLVCALVLIPATIGSPYLPVSVAQIHQNVVSAHRRYLTFDEMEQVDTEIKATLVHLRHSKAHEDKIAAEEVSALYLTRQPYIWTRVRVLHQNRAPAIMPQSPTIILAQLNPTGQVDGNSKPFLNLQSQPDIIRNAVKGLPPSQVAHIMWTVPSRQKALTSEGKHPVKTQLQVHFLRQRQRGPPYRNNTPQRLEGPSTGLQNGQDRQGQKAPKERSGRQSRKDQPIPAQTS